MFFQVKLFVQYTSRHVNEVAFCPELATNWNLETTWYFYTKRALYMLRALNFSQIVMFCKFTGCIFSIYVFWHVSVLIFYVVEFRIKF